MTAFALLFTLAAIGLAETSYLVRKRVNEEKPECPIGSGCVKVLGSEYNRTFGVHNDLLGLLFYLTMMTATALLVLDVLPLHWWAVATNVMLAGAVLMSLYFVYLQRYVIKAWCFWCLMSAATIGLMTLIVLVGGRN